MTAKFQRSRDALGGVVEKPNHFLPKEGHCSSVSGVLAGYCREGGWLGMTQMDSMGWFEKYPREIKMEEEGKEGTGSLLASQPSVVAVGSLVERRSIVCRESQWNRNDLGGVNEDDNKEELWGTLGLSLKWWLSPKGMAMG